MESLWPRIEPLLSQVTKPARYIGGELGAQAPEHRAGVGVVAPRLPGHLRDRPAQPGAADPLRDPQRAARTPWPSGPTPPGWTWRRPCGRRGCPSSRSRTTCRPGPSTCVAFNLSAELVYTNVLNLIDLAGVPVRSADRTDADPVVVAGGHCAFNPEPLADFVDCFVLGDGEEVVGEINDVLVAHGWGERRAGRPRRDGGPAGAARGTGPGAGRLRTVLLRRRLRAGRGRRARAAGCSGPAGRGHPGRDRDPRAGREADHRRPRPLALSPSPAGAAHRGGPRPSQRRAVPGVHPGVPLLPGGHDHPAGARAAGRRRSAPW